MPFVEFGRPIAAVLGRCSAAVLLLALAPAAALGGERPVGDLLPTLPEADAPLTSLAEPFEPDAPFYGVDWSLGLRGSYSHGSNGDQYQGLLLPSVTLTHTGTRLSFHGTADGQLSKTPDGAINIDQARLSAGSVLQFNPEGSLSANGALSMTQESPNAPDVASSVATTPVEISGTTDATISQKFGRFNAALRGNAERNVYGPTTLTGGAQVDNVSQNNTGAGVGLRLGLQLTPVLELFTDANAGRTVFDAPSSSLGTKLDGNTYTLKAGVAAKWDTMLEASASVGLGLEHFDDASLADVRATLYDANLTFRPSEVLTLTGNFATTIAAPGPNGGGSARIDYAATGTAAYKVNEWLSWRASAGWHDARYAETSTTDKGYDLGVGADYLLSRHLRLSADYTFGHSEITPSPPVDTHTVTVGVTLLK